MKSNSMAGAVVCLAFLVAAPALAQQTQTPAPTPAQSQFEQVASLAIGPCLRATPKTDPAGALKDCQTFIDQIALVKKEIPAATPHDVNIDLVMRATAHIRLARSHIVQSGINDARVCQNMETAWTLLSGTNAAASPTYTAQIDSLVKQQIGSVKDCRRLMGTPAGATPLPS